MKLFTVGAPPFQPVDDGIRATRHDSIIIPTVAPGVLQRAWSRPIGGLVLGSEAFAQALRRAHKGPGHAKKGREAENRRNSKRFWLRSTAVELQGAVPARLCA